MPENRTLKVLLSRVLLRYGERDRAIATLEEVRNPKPEKFASGEDEDAWYQSCQLLSDLYLEVGRPDLAVPCLIDFRQSSKSGARTLYKMGQAYEQLGDRVSRRQVLQASDGLRGQSAGAGRRGCLAAIAASRTELATDVHG